MAKELKKVTKKAKSTKATKLAKAANATKTTKLTKSTKATKTAKKELTAKERGKVSGGSGTPYSELLLLSVKCPKCGKYDFGLVDPADWMVAELCCSHCHKSSQNFPFS